MFRLTGPYWEVLHPILLKYAPTDLCRYENLRIEVFEIFNDEIKVLVDTGNEEKNYRNAIKYMGSRIDMYTLPSDYHYIDLKSGDSVKYMPNGWTVDERESMD